LVDALWFWGADVIGFQVCTRSELNPFELEVRNRTLYPKIDLGVDD
jgi:hypothetical protein